VTAVGKIFKPDLRDLAVKEKVRAEIERIFGPTFEAAIDVRKDDKLNIVVRIRIECDDEFGKQELADSLSKLPQTYEIESRSH